MGDTPEFGLLGLHSPHCLVSWNCTSLRVSRDNSWKFTRILQCRRRGLVLVQETKLRRTDPAPVEALISMVHVFRSHAVSTCSDGASGGLAFFVPGQLGYRALLTQLIEVPGFIAALPVAYGGLSWMPWNVYLHPRQRDRLLSRWLEHLQTSRQSLEAFVHVYAGDVNMDEDRTESKTLQELLEQVHGELRVEQVRPVACTYRKAGSAHSSLDVGGVPVLRQGKFCSLVDVPS